MVDQLFFSSELVGYTPVPVAGKLKTNGFNSVCEVGFCLYLAGISRPFSVVEAAPGEFHQFTPPPDVDTEAPEQPDDFPFL